jgi:hypothetical protein
VPASQQNTKTINTLYYNGEGGNGVSKYETLEAVAQNIEACVLVSKTLATTWVSIDEDAER